MGKTILTRYLQIALSLLQQDSVFRKYFYLTGGTALAEFYLHHRYSEDLDFFSETDIDKLWINAMANKLGKTLHAKKVDIQQNFNRNLVFLTIEAEILKLEFTYFPFPRINTLQVKNQLPIDSLLDIAVNKFFTIYQKPSSRHFIDLYLILKKTPIQRNELSKLARNKFDVVIDTLQLGSQMVTANEVTDLPRMRVRLS